MGRQSPEIKIRDLAAIVADVVDRNVILKDGEDTCGSPERRCPDMTKTTDTTGYEAKVDIADGVTKTYEWYRANHFERE